MDGQKKLKEKSKFALNELVLCYEPDPLKARVLYDAKILDIEFTKDAKGRKVCEYYIHFQGWNKSWDRWILEEEVLKDSESSRNLQSKLYKDALKPKRSRKRSMKQEEGEDKDNKSCISNATTLNSNEIDEEPSLVMHLPHVSLDIPKVLANRLEEDCYNIKRKKKLVHLPRTPNVNEIFYAYYEHCKKTCSKPEGRNMSLKIVVEVLEALTTYFNVYLAKLLLYNFEREQYKKWFPGSSCNNRLFSPPLTPITPKVISPTFTGDSKSCSGSTSRTSSVSEDTSLSSYVKSRQPLKTTVSKDDEVPRHKRRRRASSRHNSTTADSAEYSSTSIETRPKMQYASFTGLEEKHSSLDRSDTSLWEQGKYEMDMDEMFIKIEPMEEELTSRDEQIKGDIDSQRLRRSSRVTSQKSGDSDFMPIGFTAKSLHENRRKVNLSPLPYAKSSSKKAQTLASDPTFLPFPLTSNGKTPASVYGGEHLLRLFVKFPILVAATNMEEEKVEVVIRYAGNLLEYLAARTDLFSTSVYSESVL